jgi:hypothetical protein
MLPVSVARTAAACGLAFKPDSEFKFNFLLFEHEQFTDQEQVRPGLARAVTGQAAYCRGQMPRRVPLRFHVTFVVPYDRDSQKLPATED